MQNQNLDAAPRASRPDLDAARLITAKQLRELLGDCSEMHIWRLLNDESHRALNFPRMFKIGKRNFWKMANVTKWIATQAAKSARKAA